MRAMRELSWPRILILSVTVVAAGCATHRPGATAAVPSSPAATDLSDLIRDGCYRCLEKAFADAEASHSRSPAFEAAALLVLRSKELGLPAEPWLDRARALAAADGSSAMYLDIVDAIPPDRLSEDHESLLNFSGRTRARGSITMWREALRSGAASDAFRAYLDVSIVCAFGTLKESDQSFSGSADPVAVTPLFQYAIGICDSTHAARLSALRAREADFVDADYALGRYAVEDPVSPDPEEGLRRLESAAAAFPRSPAIATRIGNLHRAWEDWAPALAAYDAAIAIAPNHPEALIGKTISLSQLSRPQEAITAATRVIDAGQWLLGEAHYWRAWNQLRLGNFGLARSDADRARTLMANSAVFVLSGVIEWRLGRRETAEREFQEALTIDLGECEAAFDLGVVRDERAKLPEALAAFKQAGQCTDLSITLRREAIAKILAGPGTETAKARAAALHERALKDLETRREEVNLAIRALERVRSSK